MIIVTGGLILVFITLELALDLWQILVAFVFYKGAGGANEAFYQDPPWFIVLDVCDI